jgi:hypothetical protein
MMMSNLIQTYLEKVPDERKIALRNCLMQFMIICLQFELTEAYGMLTWVVPLSSYPAGYHCAPGTPLPFLSLANQKNFLAFYHMGIYADKDLWNGFRKVIHNMQNINWIWGKVVCGSKNG